jgi:hypothetical protein
MKLRNTSRRASSGRHWLTAAALAASGGAHAFNFQLFDNAVDGSFDTTVGYGLMLRTEDPDPRNFGNQYGNRYLFQDKWDIVSNLVKASHDLQLNGDGWSAFVRGNYFYDAEMDHQKLPSASRDRAVQHGDITDAYFLTRFGPTDQFTVRVGKQVISWGENTFIGGSLNDINTVDISKVRQPGIELKDALTGTNALYGSWAVNPAISLEAFWLLNYDELKADPLGGFFGTLDIITDGGGFPTGVGPRGPVALAPDGGSTGFGPLTRGHDKRPSAWGQYGAALRYYAPNLGNGFDFGLYYERLDDHNPQVSTIVGSRQFNITYADAVERYGASFNTTLGPWAVSGEYSWRRNAPVQGIDFYRLAQIPNDGAGGHVFAPGTWYEGFRRYQRHQLQLTGQRLWGPMPMFKADQWNTIGEIAYGWVAKMPGSDLDGNSIVSTLGPAPTPGDAARLAAAQAAGNGFVRFDSLTRDFWGFQVKSTLTYNNILFNRINMDFNTSFRWDVEGVSPELGGAKLFYQGRKAVTVGVAFDYALRWKLGINQTFFTGGQDQFRPIGLRLASSNDRDFLAIDLSYTF